MKARQRGDFWEYVLLTLIGIMGFVLAGAAHDKGVPEKWVTALFGTLFPFFLVVYLHRRYLKWFFGVALAVCLLVHVILMAAVFQYVFANLPRVSPLFWLPIMLFETFVLIIAVKRIEDKLSGHRNTIKLSF